MDGWRRQAKTFLSRWAPSAWTRPTAVVDLPSPRGVGLMPATTMYLQRCARFVFSFSGYT